MSPQLRHVLCRRQVQAGEPGEEAQELEPDQSELQGGSDEGQGDLEDGQEEGAQGEEGDEEERDPEDGVSAHSVV